LLLAVVQVAEKLVEAEALEAYLRVMQVLLLALLTLLL
jgi:hypothetical protein